MNTDLLLQVYVLPLTERSAQLIPPNFHVISNDSNFIGVPNSDVEFKYYIKIFLACGLVISTIDKSRRFSKMETKTYPFCMLDDQGFAGLYFHSKYMVLDHFNGWTDFGAYSGPTFYLTTDVPYGTPDHHDSHKAQATLHYNCFEIGIRKVEEKDCFSFLSELRYRVEHSFASILSNIKKDLE